MKKIIVGLAATCLLFSGCSAYEGQMGKKTETFEDDHGRLCTVVKWGDSASLDCDFKEN